MRAGATADSLRSPAPFRLLALLAALCLVALGAPAAAATEAGPARGLAVVDAVASAPALARTLPERLHAGVHSPAKPSAPVAAGGAAVVLLLVLLLLGRGATRPTGASRRGHLVASAGRSPPLHFCSEVPTPQRAAAGALRLDQE